MNHTEGPRVRTYLTEALVVVRVLVAEWQPPGTVAVAWSASFAAAMACTRAAEAGCPSVVVGPLLVVAVAIICAVVPHGAQVPRSSHEDSAA